MHCKKKRKKDKEKRKNPASFRDDYQPLGGQVLNPEILAALAERCVISWRSPGRLAMTAIFPIHCIHVGVRAKYERIQAYIAARALINQSGTSPFTVAGPSRSFSHDIPPIGINQRTLSLSLSSTPRDREKEREWWWRPAYGTECVGLFQPRNSPLP